MTTAMGASAQSGSWARGTGAILAGFFAVAGLSLATDQYSIRSRSTLPGASR